MTATTTSPKGRIGDVSATAWTAALTGWHTVHLVGAVVAALVLLGSDEPSGAVAIGLLVTAIAAAVADLVTIVGLRRRRPAGLLGTVVIGYLTAVGAAAVLLQRLGVFTGMDALGDTFVRGVPFLLLAVAAYAATASTRLARVARWVAIASLAAMLIAVGLLPGLLTFVGRLAGGTELALLVIAVTGAVVAFRSRRSDVVQHLRATRATSATLDGLLFVSPNALGFLAFFAGPLLFSLWVSLNDWDAFGTPDFIGLANYVRIVSLSVATAEAGQLGNEVLLSGYTEVLRLGNIVIGAQDPVFWKSIVNIVVFAALAIPLSVIPALGLASLLNSDAPGIKAFRAIYFVPSIAGVVAVALIWRQLFNATVGWVNYLLDRLAVAWSALPFTPELVAGQPQWLSDDGLALISLVIVFAWQYVGFNTVLFLAGLQSIDPTLTEAAMIDGANRWQRFRYITLPQLAPTTFFVVASTGILALQLFGEAVVLFPTYTPVGSGPQGSTLTPVVYLYDQGFRRFAQGYASAVAWVLFLLIFAFTFVQFRRQRADVEGV
ncbi:N-Acetyl-D-glucosamine ABC transport system, permease protein 1 [Euzebya pacifica]|uniref:N-Acetyl-D-glucosamine ABC transport system, permease protein 1 n=1 Tax=Euzebya pacifica TaxID=1608957 RepID=A0A346XVW6_9ACTN|nr:sugar ABC transporter permease [Euzebya pacifica]AXV06363.1 N-Acetyl-D-glucosamine ABC transport system, permease protein 1 [Euzebya pacifica]